MRGEARLDNLPRQVAGTDSITRYSGYPVTFEALIGQIDQPIFEDAVAGVERPLDGAVVSQGTVGHLDNQQNIGGRGMIAPVKVVARTGDNDVRLGLGKVTEPNRILRRDDHAITQFRVEESGKPFDAAAVFATNGRHIDDLSFD
uniref:Uncharacterized protein n=1 Tax=Candidatus Kentrum sp. LPFa TaxID=2126335 RepID=A0A450WA98_9GAMM|nr:MAG: hypothetical protein BECKLPF1236B_GA0070989_10537 [Candidatus Kentron sp. LPFa]